MNQLLKNLISVFSVSLLLIVAAGCNDGAEFSTKGKNFLLGESDNMPPVTNTDVIDEALASGPSQGYIAASTGDEGDVNEGTTDQDSLKGRVICLWPPNHKMVSINFADLAPNGGAVTEATSSQPDQMEGIEGDRTGDIAAVEDKPAAKSFRSERWFEPRVYTVKLANDEKPFYVVVPHNFSPMHMVKVGDSEVNCHTIIRGEKKVGKPAVDKGLDAEPGRANGKAPVAL